MNSLQAADFTLPNTDLFKGWSLPVLNVGLLLEVQRKNAVALTKANQVVFEGLMT